jgi:TPR repeat protein
METNQVETEVADSEPERRGGPWKLILLVVVVTLIGVWLVPGDPEPEESAADTGEPPSLLDLPATAAGGAPKLPAALEKPAIDERPGAHARSLIARMRASGELELDAIFSAAERAQQDGELADAYLLYFFAAREGFAPAAMALATQADPASRDAGSSVFDAADLTQAHKWYQLAADQGDAEARKRLADLRARVEQMAAAGDTQAQRTALQWQ